jgi:hypothetical protein
VAPGASERTRKTETSTADDPSKGFRRTSLQPSHNPTSGNGHPPKKPAAHPSPLNPGRSLSLVGGGANGAVENLWGDESLNGDSGPAGDAEEIIEDTDDEEGS